MKNLIIILVFFISSGLIKAQTPKTVKIGNQVWMSENLNANKYINGEQIPEAKTSVEWNKASRNKQPAWCYYNNDTTNGVKYGKLYNWYSVIDKRGLCPTGWHVPSDNEWNQLYEFLGGSDVAYKKLNSTSGFHGLRGGLCMSGAFSLIGDDSYYWSSTEGNLLNSAWARQLDNNFFSRQARDREEGFSVRCLKD